MTVKTTLEESYRQTIFHQSTMITAKTTRLKYGTEMFDNGNMRGSKVVDRGSGSPHGISQVAIEILVRTLLEKQSRGRSVRPSVCAVY